MYITIYSNKSEVQNRGEKQGRGATSRFRTGERSRGGKRGAAEQGRGLTLVLPLRVEAVGWR
jgi:hypothetical protein